MYFVFVVMECVLFLLINYYYSYLYVFIIVSVIVAFYFHYVCITSTCKYITTGFIMFVLQVSTYTTGTV